MLKRLIGLTLLLTFVVVVLGAYVRLSDAGLGCPDWPGCYGQLTPHHAADEIAAAEAAQPGGPVSMPKAWKEMIHRYLASLVGLLCVVIAVIAWQRWRRTRERMPVLESVTVLVVCFQGVLGMWTVTWLLKPAIVTLHLLGGLATLSLLLWQWLRVGNLPRIETSPFVARAARVALVVLGLQIALGGWVSTNYAALACLDFPTCHGEWLPEMDVANAFHVVRELGMTAEGEFLSLQALTAIHFVHRLGALVAGLALFAAAYLLWRAAARRAALGIATLTAAQIALGIANVWLSLPLPLAVAHNAMAALLLCWLLGVNYCVRTDDSAGKGRA